MTELGRHLSTFQEQMERHRATMENALYAAEQLCPDYHHIPYCKNEACPFFYLGQDRCGLKRHRNQMGDHIPQHDAMPGVPPCPCAGDCGKQGVGE